MASVSPSPAVRPQPAFDPGAPSCPKIADSSRLGRTIRFVLDRIFRYLYSGQENPPVAWVASRAAAAGLARVP
jgi:hypothetical protein